MAKNKNQKRKDAISLKNAQETLRFQVQWGLKKLGVSEGEVIYKLAMVELEHITEHRYRKNLSNRMHQMNRPDPFRSAVH